MGTLVLQALGFRLGTDKSDASQEGEMKLKTGKVH